VQIRDLVYRRGERTIFDGMDINIARGKLTAIMGPSGTGKTTLLRLIGGQLRPDAGTVHVDGQSVPELGYRRFMTCANVWACCFRMVPC